ncbi:MAG: primosomal protein N' [Candidatus Omnitrophota bacterium]
MPLPVMNLFSYSIPEGMEALAVPGVRVRVPFRNTEMTGYLVGKSEAPPGTRTKPLLEILDDAPVVSASVLALTRWIADYYGSSWGEAIENALPKWVKYGKKAERMLERAEKSAPPPSGAAELDRVLSRDQEKALGVILRRLDEPSPRPILLHGVTGSGKSEIYIRAIREILKRGRSSICLVPEIALTEQLRLFFLSHFGPELEILHSKLSDGERFLTWKRLEKGEKRVILGPRSAVFAPVPKLGLIVMDEEHEGTYKQETSPRYHAREVAAWRAAHEGALFVMGTATPSLETMHDCETGRFERLVLSTRIDDKAMPQVQVVDLKEAAMDHKKQVILAPRLASEIEMNLKKGEGTLLLLNRRGFSTRVQCPSCGNTESCQSCQVSLTYHQEEDRLLCHYCNFSRPASGVCSFCRTPVLKFSGFGTEKVESETARRFPGAKIARMDADSVRKKGSHEAILKAFRERKIDILIGTQMIAKGFDFPHVTLVGVVLADVGLSLPDFRSAERTFQLLTQVAGRAGRGDKPGRVIVQTFSPEHPSILFAKKHDYASFYEYEKVQRQQYGYPPYGKLINVIIRAKDEKKAYQFARAVRDAVREQITTHRLPATKGEEAQKGFGKTISAACVDEEIGAQPVRSANSERSRRVLEKPFCADSMPPVGTEHEIEIVGPAPLPFYKLRGHYRWHVMLKYPENPAMSAAVAGAVTQLKKPSGVAYALDVDPVNIL